MLSLQKLQKLLKYSQVFAVKSWIRVYLSTKRPLLKGEEINLEMCFKIQRISGLINPKNVP